MKKIAYLFLFIIIGIVIVISAIFVSNYIMTGDENAVLSYKVQGFLESHPDSQQLRDYLRGKGIESETYHTIPPVGSWSAANSILRRSEPAASIFFQIFDVEKTWCGDYSDRFRVVYDKNGQFLGTGIHRLQLHCFDF